MKIDLSAEEGRVLLRLVRDAIDASRFPMSPEIEALRDLANKLRVEEEPKPSES